MGNITQKYITTKRLTQHVQEVNSSAPTAVVFIHGNASSSVFWEECLEKLPPQYRGIAPDLRGYGATEDCRIDATLGMGDFVADLLALIKELNINDLHLVGHSMGGSVIWALAPHLGTALRSITQVNPGSPYGFGGTKDNHGTPCQPDFAGSGGGIVNPQFTQYIAQKYRGSDDPLAAPRIVMNQFYFKPPFKAAREEALLDSLLSEKIGPDRYPGDFTPSANYPFVAPGIWGPANALSPKYIGDSPQIFLNNPHKAPVLWVRGSDDQIVSDQSLFCLGTLGKMGLIPNYPGEAVYPPQPMVSQTRTFLTEYAAKEGFFEEYIMENTGHTPFIEQPEAFLKALIWHLDTHSRT